MKQTKMLFPDAVAGGGVSTKKYTPTRSLPLADIDLADTATKVNAAWISNPLITLAYIKQPVFETIVNDFRDTLGLRRQQGSLRPEQTEKLNVLDQQAEAALPNVKTYIAQKYEDENAEAYYAQFGIVHSDKRWILPFDRQERNAALSLMIKGIHDHGFDANKYGKTFWTELQVSYTAALGNSTDIDKGVSGKVGTKNTQKRNINKVLKSLIRVLEGNYPDEYKQKLREWGFQKEDY